MSQLMRRTQILCICRHACMRCRACGGELGPACSGCKMELLEHLRHASPLIEGHCIKDDSDVQWRSSWNAAEKPQMAALYASIAHGAMAATGLPLSPLAFAHRGASGLCGLRCSASCWLTSMRMSRTRCPGIGSPVRLSTTSMRMVAPHLAFKVSPDRYLAANVLLQRRWGVCLQSSQWASRHPRLLEVHITGHHIGQRAVRLVDAPLYGQVLTGGRVLGAG